MYRKRVKLLKLKVISNNAHIKETRNGKDKDKENEEEINQTKNLKAKEIKNEQKGADKKINYCIFEKRIMKIKI